MQTASYRVPAPQSFFSRLTDLLMQLRDWLDARGKLAWIAAMVLGFIAFWPVGLAILGYMIWSKRMFGCHRHAYRPERFSGRTGNVAFDAYRDETLKRLEEEHREFIDFLQKLREAKDKAEFDQFMAQRGEKDDKIDA